LTEVTTDTIDTTDRN